MEPSSGRLEWAEVRVREVLAASERGVPAIVLVDRLVQAGFEEAEGMAILRALVAQRRLASDRGYVVAPR